MRALLLEAPESVLAERRRLGLDGHDETWDGVLHVVPPASGDHQVPDLLVSHPPDRSRRGAGAAGLVVEICSAGDELCAELFHLADDRLLPVTAEGGVRSDVPGVRSTARDGRVRLARDGGGADRWSAGRGVKAPRSAASGLDTPVPAAAGAARRRTPPAWCR